MHRLQRVLTVLSLVLSLSVFGGPLLTGPSHAAASSQHDGRLGGSSASFASRFGSGKGSASSKSGVTYRSADYASIVVLFNKDRAIAIDLKPATGDWAPDAADSAATNLLPTDDTSTFKRLDTGDGRFEVACHSRDLGKVFSSSDYKKLNHKGVAGDCAYLLSPTAIGDVSELSLSIGRAGALDRPAPVGAAAPIATSVAEPTAAPDTSTFIGADGCTYANATGAQVSCPAPASNGSTSGGSTNGGSSGGSTNDGSTGGSTSGGDTGTYTGADGCTYTNVDGNQISCPVVADSPPAGATAQCNDGTYSFSAHHQGTCSSHGGVAVFYQ